MAARSFTILASLLAVASASPCKLPTYTLPETGTGTELPAVAAGLSLLRIAVGHGIQNYTCASTTAATTATGALAVLYDITHLYPGTLSTGLSSDAFNAISGQLLWGQDIPLNLQSASAASPGSPAAPNDLSETEYGAVVADPFPSPSPLSLPGVLAAEAPFLGHHYFDATGVPTFDLSGSGLFGSMNKTGDVKAPSTAQTGILATGAVDWLQLTASSNGLSVGIKQVYRVITAGGASETCAVLNAAGGSVPYTAFYWFFG
ncbi:hypothetical protein SCUCBS95973_001459 [Sporothrix curviconia]|uniref:Malate dehydrogenase n=1 Tax=Sporothrix curviconia TaxID=1260050 RepID=A0ABP0AYT0_9PEZI